DFTGMVVKLLVVIGGFARMVNPPRIISSKLDSGGGFEKALQTKEGVAKIKKNYTQSKNTIKGVVGKSESIVGKAFLTTPYGKVVKYAGKLVPPIMRKK